MDFSEYETASEFAQDFESDHEPPKDQLFLKKMVHKSEKLRIYKRIAKIGKTYMEMPAKCDQVVLRIKKLFDNSLEQNLEKEKEKESFDTKTLSDFQYLLSLSSSAAEDFNSESQEPEDLVLDREQRLRELLKNSEDLRVLQLGRDLMSDALVLSVSNMKKGELSFFEIEEVGFHHKTKERKLFGKQYYLIELVDFITIIDIYGNGEAFKMQLDKGQGIRRINRADRMNARLALKNSAGKTLWSFQNIDKGYSFSFVIGRRS
jgi:hypothetical protein